MFLLFDIGGTKMRFAASEDGKKFGKVITEQTPKSFSSGIGAIPRAAFGLAPRGKFKKVVGGIAGPLDKEKTMVMNAPNLPQWNKKPLARELEKAFGARVYLENDTALVGLGEAVQGAGKKHRIVAYLTVSTGVGGARIVDCAIDRNAIGFEPGHQLIFVGSASKHRCPSCYVPGHLEGYVSGAAVEARYGKKPYEIKDLKFWKELAEWLAVGLNNTIVHWSPDAVVLGGPMIVGSPAIPIDLVRRRVKEILTIFPEVPPIKKAALGDLGGLHGALAYIRQQGIR